METLTQEPTLSLKEMQLKEADLFISNRINELAKEGLSFLAAVRKIYEEVKGQKYREEQVAAKLLELLAAQNEVDMRTKEIVQIAPDVAKAINNFSEAAANDDRYKVAA